MGYFKSYKVDTNRLGSAHAEKLRKIAESYKKGLKYVNKFCTKKTFVFDENGQVIEADFLGIAIIGFYGQTHQDWLYTKPYEVFDILSYDNEEENLLKPNSLFFMICMYNDNEGHEGAYNYILDIILNYERKKKEEELLSHDLLQKRIYESLNKELYNNYDKLETKMWSIKEDEEIEFHKKFLEEIKRYAKIGDKKDE